MTDEIQEVKEVVFKSCEDPSYGDHHFTIYAHYDDSFESEHGADYGLTYNGLTLELDDGDDGVIEICWGFEIPDGDDTSCGFWKMSSKYCSFRSFEFIMSAMKKANTIHNRLLSKDKSKRKNIDEKYLKNMEKACN